jgi:hypothetical protein
LIGFQIAHWDGDVVDGFNTVAYFCDHLKFLRPLSLLISIYPMPMESVKQRSNKNYFPQRRKGAKFGESMAGC